MSGIVHVPWYATGFRGDQLQAELERVTPLSVRYGATFYAIHRGRDDRYKLLQMLEFEEAGGYPGFALEYELVPGVSRAEAKGDFFAFLSESPTTRMWNSPGSPTTEARSPRREPGGRLDPRGAATWRVLTR